MYDIDSNVSVKAATKAERAAIHAKHLGQFVRSGVSAAPRATPKPPKTFRAATDPRNKHGTVDRPPLFLDPMFRTFKGDSKASAIKDASKRKGQRQQPMRKPRAKGPAQTPSWAAIQQEAHA